MLAEKGFYVISIQHDLPSDSPIARTGNIFQKHKPLWDKGVKSISFVVNEMKRRYPNMDFTNLTLIGHSNGGDISMYFATKHPQQVKNVITLDSLRFPFLRTSSPKILSIRSYDKEADPYVLPSVKEQVRFDIKIVKLANAKHEDFYDKVPQKIKQEINSIITEFLQ